MKQELSRNGCLRWVPQKNGTPRVQGIYSLKDEIGFPLSSSLEVAQEKGWDIDWVEAMADAGRHEDRSKLVSLNEELALLIPEQIGAVRMIFMSGVLQYGPTFGKEECECLYREMRGHDPGGAK